MDFELAVSTTRYHHPPSTDCADQITPLYCTGKSASAGIVSSDRGTDPDPAHARPNSSPSNANISAAGTTTRRSEYYIARNNARAVQLVNRGHSFYMWQWDHGYTDAFRAWRRVHRL
ncbi:hypothetical protein BOTBODRAFT_38398 [Botryobasidium botryosum FD-172 SS1]|uniref:Uncharacterized protein n=1 Tax=Botryobasidium botryosum (strain FD-172 SS1) TaxID=930990 RepID=A0A067LXN0_BOTB1|nr:hypothetical protein BOTBODRAFT_38398 [Botryobasidium botryosum FD-172 SS1]